ncbi:DNA repair protein RecN [Paludibacteraceae bacterium OttesenSCG-928-F17]|nr:DNA repair protein RecN [Paludibacteraceae bacterium OttesenSCG-928-F17]
MLKSIHISDYALISEIEIDFEGGLSVITGETGAGKSIILGALSLILGERADSRMIREGASKCIIEANFNIADYNVQHFFDENELDYDEKNCIIRRELNSAGKSRSFINDTPVSLTQLRELTAQLVDIHSQHENLLLSNSQYQLQVVDTIANNSGLLQDYRDKFHTWKGLQKEIKELKETAEKQLADLEYIRFQYQQLADANLVEGELYELEQEQKTLSHAEEIKTELSRVTHLLGGEQMGVALLKDSLQSLERVKTYIQEGEDWLKRLESTYIELKDIASDISSLEEGIEFNPQRLETVENRLSELYDYFKKYRVSTIDELIQLRGEFEEKLTRIESFDDEIQRLENQIGKAEEVLKQSAHKLTESRKNASKPIEEYLVEQLSQLGMPNVRFEVEISPTNTYTENGTDNVRFLFSANKNKTLQPVVEIASGGEISRLMLTIKSLMARRSDLPTIIFDEIDTGVSGEIAYRMGEIMKDMSRAMQVITITHLPQIAGKGDHHYKVFKDEENDQVNVFINRLNDKERVNEIAQMISGRHLTEEAIRQAEQLLK